MRKFLSSALYVFFFILSLNTAAPASDITVKGAAYFKCNFISTYMEKHGYVLIEKDLYLKNLKIDRYAANFAEVIIKNQNNAVIGAGETDEKGRFSIAVPGEHFYRVVVRFHDSEIEQVVSYSDAGNVIVDMGYFDTEKVGSWIPIPPLQYCYKCPLRYLETKKSL